MKVKVCSPDGDTDFFNIVAGVLQEDTLALYLFIICLDYVLLTSIDQIKENGFTLKKARSKRYPAEATTDADYADDLVLLAQAEPQLYRLEQVVGGIGLYTNANKTDYMCFKWKGTISTLKWQTSKVSRQVHIPRQQYLIYWKGC